MKRYFGICALAVALLVASSATGLAEDAKKGELYQPDSKTHKRMTKLGRGTLNLFTGWFEIPHHMAISVRQTDLVSGSFVGFFRGVGWGFHRTVAGAYEVVTFPFATKYNFEPVVYPEYLITTIWAEPFPIISDPHNNWVEPRVPDYGTGEPDRRAGALY